MKNRRCWFGTQKVKLHPNKPPTFLLLYVIANEKNEKLMSSIGCDLPQRLLPQKHIPITLVGIHYLSLIDLRQDYYKYLLIGKSTGVVEPTCLVKRVSSIQYGYKVIWWESCSWVKRVTNILIENISIWGLWGNLISGSVQNQSLSSGKIVMNLGCWDNSLFLW